MVANIKNSEDFTWKCKEPGTYSQKLDNRESLGSHLCMAAKGGQSNDSAFRMGISQPASRRPRSHKSQALHLQVLLLKASLQVNSLVINIANGKVSFDICWTEGGRNAYQIFYKGKINPTLVPCIKFLKSQNRKHHISTSVFPQNTPFTRSTMDFTTKNNFMCSLKTWSIQLTCIKSNIKDNRLNILKDSYLSQKYLFNM